MKQLILLLIILFASCNNNNQDKKINPKDLNKSFAKIKRSFNLLTNNLEVPNECKPPLSTEENKRAFVRLRGRINRCAFYLNEVPDLNNFFNVKDCFKEIGSTFDEVTDQSCRELVTIPGAVGNITDVMNSLLRNYYTTNVRIISGTETVFNWDNVTDYFSLWANWFNETRDAMYLTSDTQVLSQAHSVEFQENVLRPFWDDVQNYTVEWRSTFGDIVKEISPTNEDGSPKTPEEIAEERLDKNNKFEIFKTMLGVNQKIIDYAFESELSAKITSWETGSTEKYASPLLAALIGDSVAPFFERLKVITKIYDVACKLKNCTKSFYEQNKTYWMLRLLNGIANDSDIENFELDRDDPLNNFLMTLYDRKTEINSIVSAINKTFGVESISTIEPGSDFPSFLSSFTTMFSSSYDLLQSFENTTTIDKNGIERAGFFSSGKISEVNVGFSKSNMDRHITSVKNSNDRLEVLRSKFDSQKHTLISEVLALNASAIQLDQLESKINIDLTDLYNTSGQIDAVRNFIYESNLTFADQVKNLISNQSSGQEEFFTHPTQTYVANASETSIGNPDVIDGSILHNIDPEGSFSKGDMLQVTTSGEWSATCGISKTYGEGVVNAKASSKGYAMVQTDGVSQVRSVDDYSTKESFSSQSLSVETCVGASSPAKFIVKASINVCANATWGTRTSSGTRKSTTDSTSRRSDASFNIGVTSSNTPYPYIPAGSLLLVVMPKGENLKIEYSNIYILNGNDTFVVEKDNQDYYLIGNDCSADTNNGSLTVNVTRQSPQGEQASNFIEKIQAISSKVEERVSALINNGQLSHELLQSIKNELLGTTGIDINNFNGTVRQLLESFISNHIALLDYKSQLVNMERNLETKKLTLLSLLEQFGAENEQRFLRVHTRNWLLSNMDLDFVNQSDENQNLYTLNRVLNSLENSLVSYLDFKYRDEEREYILGNIDLLSSIDISDNFDTISSRLTTYVSTLLDNLQDDLDNNPLIPQTTVGIRIPNPYYEPSFEPPFPEVSLHPVMDESRATNFWNKLINFKRFAEKGEELSFNIFIEDLYQDNGLSCYAEAPIIESVGLFFIPENEGYVTGFNNNYRHKNSKLFIDGVSQVPFETILREYNFVNEAWRYMDAATRMAISPEDAMSKLVSEYPPSPGTESGLGTGRPLFGKFKIGDIKGFNSYEGEVTIGYTPLKEIKELFIGYVVSASNSNFDVNLNWIDYCQEK